MLDAREKVLLLEKPAWSYKDIMEYTGCGVNKAIKIKQTAIDEFNGFIKYQLHKARTDSIIQCLGSTREREIAVLLAAAGSQKLC